MFHFDILAHKQTGGHTWSGKSKNNNYLPEEGMPHCVLSQDSCSQYFTNDVCEKLFDNLKTEPSIFIK